MDFIDKLDDKLGIKHEDESKKRNLYNKIFLNLGSKKRNLRLTKFGLSVCNKHFETYEIKFPENFVILLKHYIFLEKNMCMPYYIGKKKLILFDPNWALRLKLSSGDLTIMSDNQNLYIEEYNEKKNRRS